MYISRPYRCSQYASYRQLWSHQACGVIAVVPGCSCCPALGVSTNSLNLPYWLDGNRASFGETSNISTILLQNNKPYLHQGTQSTGYKISISESHELSMSGNMLDHKLAPLS